MRVVKSDFDKDHLSQLENDFKIHNTRNFYNIFKNVLQQNQPPSLCFKNEEGKLAVEIIVKY